MRRLMLRLQGAIFVLLLLAVLGLCAWLTERNNVEWSWVGGLRHELTEPSQRLLTRLDGEVAALAFVPDDPVLRRHVSDLLDRYAARKPDFQYQLVNPETRPDLVRELGISRPAEIVLQYQGRQERAAVPSEAHLSGALERLLRRQEQFIAFLSGHGERSLLGEANHDLGSFGAVLRQKGYRLQPLNLLRIAEVPDNTALLVVATPQTELLPAELERLGDYVKRGGNLLWLADPEEPVRLEVLESALGVRWSPGVILDPVAAMTRRTGDARLVLVEDHLDHAVTARLAAPLLFIQAKSFTVQELDWELIPLVMAAGGQFLQVDYEPGQTLQAPAQATPLPVAVGFERRVGERRQRAVVVGDGDFLSNTYIGNGANLQLGLNLVDWLTASEQLLDSYARAAPDQVLELQKGEVMLIGFGFLLGIPGLCLLIVLWQWWRRRSG